jgi:hypothetical protein
LKGDIELMTNGTSELPLIIGQSGPLNGQRWYLDKSVVIGRDPGCDIVIPDRQVSRYHARMTRENGGVLLEDLGSKNGTYLNGSPISEPSYLADSDVVQVALVQHFVFLSSDATMPVGIGPQGTIARKRLKLDQASKQVWVHGKELLPPLSVPQFRLLQLIYEKEGQVVSRPELIDFIWGEEGTAGVTEQALDALVRRLRERLRQTDYKHQYIITIRGHGLRFDNHDE